MQPFMNLFKQTLRWLCYFSITETGSDTDYQAPLVHESFSANAGCVFAITGIGSGTDYQVPLSEGSIRTIETTTHGK